MKGAGSAIVLLAVFAANVCGDPASPPITGTVFDPSGAVVPGASITLQRDGIPLTSTTADARGAFVFESIPPGRYEVAARQEGFKVVTSRVVVGTRPPSPLKLRLQIAQVVEELSVGSETASTRSDENRDAVSVDREMLNGLPSLDQNYSSALSRFLDPAVIGSGGPALIVDGVEANRVLVSPSAIEAVKINQNPYSAEYFRPGRGRIEIITKQATADYHGALNVLFRDSRLDAQDFFATEKAPQRRHIYEGSLSGPVPGSTSTSFRLSFDRKVDDVQAIVVAAGPGGAIRQSVLTPQRGTDLSFRLGRQLGKRHSVWAEYGFEDRAANNQGIGGFALPEVGTSAASREQDVVLGHQFLASSKLVSQLSVQCEWNRSSTTSLNPAPRLVVQDAFTGGGAQADQHGHGLEFKLFENVSWTSGRHLLKAGLQVADVSRRTSDDLSNRGGTFFFSSLEDYQRGHAYAFAQQHGDGYVSLWAAAIGGYVQDEIQVKPNLTLALGARYDYQKLIHAGLVSPRLFTAFAPGKGRGVVLRGGIGLFNDRVPPSLGADIVRYDGRHLASYLVLDPTFSDAGAAALAAQPVNLSDFDPSIGTPYTIQYSLGAEWRVARTNTFSATYRGSRGVKLFRSRDINAPQPPGYLGRPDPTVGRLREIESAGLQVGDALDLAFKVKLGKIVSGLAQYSLSRTDTDTNGFNFFPASSSDPRADWGPADFDQRHRLNLLTTVDLKGLAKVGVIVSAASGKPYTLTTGRDENRDGFATDRPAGIHRNSLRGPGFFDVDLRLSRDVFFDRAKREKGPTAAVSLDLFNAFNREDTTTIVGNLSSAFFGQAVAAVPARRVQLSARFSF